MLCTYRNRQIAFGVWGTPFPSSRCQGRGRVKGVQGRPPGLCLDKGQKSESPHKLLQPETQLPLSAYSLFFLFLRPAGLNESASVWCAICGGWRSFDLFPQLTQTDALTARIVL